MTRFATPTPFLRRLATTLMVMVMAIAFFAPLAGEAASKSGGSSGGIFYVPLNRAELISTNVDMSEVVVTDPEVANVLVHGKRKVSVIGMEIGQTTLRIFDANHKLLRNVDVFVTFDLPAVRKALKQFLPNERIGVSMVNTRMALTGDVSSAASAATAMEIAETFLHAKQTAEQSDTRRLLQPQTENSPILNMMKI